MALLPQDSLCPPSLLALLGGGAQQATPLFLLKGRVFFAQLSLYSSRWEPDLGEWSHLRAGNNVIELWLKDREVRVRVWEACGPWEVALEVLELGADRSGPFLPFCPLEWQELVSLGVPELVAGLRVLYLDRLSQADDSWLVSMGRAGCGAQLISLSLGGASALFRSCWHREFCLFAKKGKRRCWGTWVLFIVCGRTLSSVDGRPFFLCWPRKKREPKSWKTMQAWAGASLTKACAPWRKLAAATCCLS